MIAKLRGIAEAYEPDQVILWVGSTGYLVHTVDTGVGEMEYYIHEIIKENDYTLVGFKEYDDLLYFRFLLSINGIGLKSALLIMKNFTQEEVEKSPQVLKKVKGIGERTIVSLEKLMEKKNVKSTSGQKSR